ncbi:hypothetical protein AAMO2058_001025300 [Amorphochlora amoebiformis]
MSKDGAEPSFPPPHIEIGYHSSKKYPLFIWGICTIVVLSVSGRDKGLVSGIRRGSGIRDGIDIPRWSILRCRGGGDMLPGEDPGRANEPIDMDEEYARSLPAARDPVGMLDSEDDVPEDRPSSFTIVKIPADDGEPLQEIEVTTPPEEMSKYTDILYDFLRPIFEKASHGEVDKSQLNRYWGANMAALPNAGLMTSFQSVEVFWLTLSSPENKHQQVQFYLDETGKLKNLAPNRRAKHLASLAGRYQEEFNGDIYVGRLRREIRHVREEPLHQVNPKGMYNIDFRISDMDKSDKWISEAYADNLKTGIRMQELQDKLKSQGVEVRQKGAALQPKSQSCPHFWWTQSEDEIEVNIPLSSDVNPTDIEVKFGSESLEVFIAGAKDLQLRLFNKILPDESTWLLDRKGKGKVLQITLVKNMDETWSTLELGMQSASQVNFQQNDLIVKLMLQTPKGYFVRHRDISVNSTEGLLNVFVKTQEFVNLELFDEIQPKYTVWEYNNREGVGWIDITMVKKRPYLHWTGPRKPDPNENREQEATAEDYEKHDQLIQKIERDNKEISNKTGKTYEEEYFDSLPPKLRDYHRRLDSELNKTNIPGSYDHADMPM